MPVWPLVKDALPLYPCPSAHVHLRLKGGTYGSATFDSITDRVAASSFCASLMDETDVVRYGTGRSGLADVLLTLGPAVVAGEMRLSRDLLETPDGGRLATEA
jgi:hypothetical protein